MSESGMRGQVVLVSGAASGIGAAVMQRLMAEGARVGALDQRPVPGAHASASADLRSPQAVAAAIAELGSTLGRPVARWTMTTRSGSTPIRSTCSVPCG
jgi:NAD(P)-dependent dehydrogenase (short-subunit alcohol dehydrogenase family)